MDCKNKMKRTTTTTAETMERLSEDIIMDIISRLSIKCVLRCRCVCKSWNIILSTPLFSTTHFNNLSSPLTSSSIITHYTISYYKYPQGNLLYFVEDDNIEAETFAVTRPKHLKFPFSRSAIFMGSCNGHLCCSAAHETHPSSPSNPIYLIDPINGEHFRLPVIYQAIFFKWLSGMGAATQQYKVVLVYFFNTRMLKNLVQVHTVGSDHWREVDNVPELPMDVLEASLPLTLNGSIHWVILNSIDNGKNARILSFQLDTEEFRYIPAPEPLEALKTDFYTSFEYALQVCQGCLSIIYSPSTSIVDVWVMTDYGVKESWVKQYSIGLYRMGSPCYLKPIGFRRNGELMLYVGNKGLVSYSIKSGRHKLVELDGVILDKPAAARGGLFPFTGSLISLESAYAIGTTDS